jgi:hypothetical protein
MAPTGNNCNNNNHMSTDNISSQYPVILGAAALSAPPSFCHFHRRYGHPGRMPSSLRTSTRAKGIPKYAGFCTTHYPARTLSTDVIMIILLIIYSAVACKDINCTNWHGTTTVAISFFNINQSQQQTITATSINKIPLQHTAMTR